MSERAGYPNREHGNADKAARRRALAALNGIEDETRMLRRKIATEVADGDDTQVLADHVRLLTRDLAVLGTLRDVREWHAADVAG